MRVCDEYLPIIVFENNLNLFGKFNTFRLGLGYSRKLKVNDRVLLTYKSNSSWSNLSHTARVTEIHTGPLNTMLDNHAENNHLVKNLVTSKLDKIAKLDKILTGIYKRYGCELDSDFTVIDLEA